MVIDIVDFEKKELAWRGIGTGTVEDAKENKEQEQQIINEIVAKILDGFPPK